jgi:3-hydroxyacyl-CoA dehydrogenase / enoyl-CoA hydratase / 3-hydroxybutyryl-CoA epimerase
MRTFPLDAMTAAEPLSNWRIERDGDDIAWLTFDRPDAPANSLSRAALAELAGHIVALAANPPRALVLQSGKPGGFIAGADVSEFTRLRDKSAALDFVRLGWQTFERIAALAFPVVCLIRGYCMGGGLELALACRFRIADDGPDTRLGLPEVRLGIYPAWGGIRRLPQLIGAAPALDMLLTGKSVDAAKAKTLGLIDAAVPARHLVSAARTFALNPPVPRRPRLAGKLANLSLGRPLLAALLRRRLAARVDARDYPAPYAIIELWEKYDGDPLSMPAVNGGSIPSLLTSETAHNLMRCFFLQERLKGLGRTSGFHARHAHVVGAGVMGGDIAAWCALRGLTVTLQDESPQQIAPAVKRAHELFVKRLQKPHRIDAAMDRLIPDARALGVAKADIVIEAIYEDAAAKRALYREIEPRMKSGAFLATNTSSIPLEQLHGSLGQPERLVGLHFFNPVAQMQLVEVVSSTATAAEVAQAALAFTRELDRLPLPVRSSPGFLVNRVLRPYLMEAMTLAAEGIVPEAIDQAAVRFGMPVGPLELADTVGLDICLAAGGELGADGAAPAAKLLQDKVAAGHLGRKSGRGFYAYRAGKALKSRSVSSGSALARRLMVPLLRECEICLSEGVVADADLLDAGLIFGAGFPPRLGGPLHFLASAAGARLMAEAARPADETPGAGVAQAASES